MTKAILPDEACFSCRLFSHQPKPGCGPTGNPTNLHPFTDPLLVAIITAKHSPNP
jgi:hypothetical protein